MVSRDCFRVKIAASIVSQTAIWQIQLDASLLISISTLSPAPFSNTNLFEKHTAPPRSTREIYLFHGSKAILDCSPSGRVSRALRRPLRGAVGSRARDVRRSASIRSSGLRRTSSSRSLRVQMSPPPTS